MRVFRASRIVEWGVGGLAVIALAGCGSPANVIAVGALGAAGVISIATIGRDPVDAVYSLVTGKDCSIVRLDRGQSYCRPVDPPPEAPEFCTHSLGSVNCWANPATVPGDPKSVADGPGPTAAQEAYRTRTWP